jgi:hypothetical protein
MFLVYPLPSPFEGGEQEKEEGKIGLIFVF